MFTWLHRLLCEVGGWFGWHPPGHVTIYPPFKCTAWLGLPTMGPRIRHLRRKQGLSSTELAAKVGISSGYLNRLEQPEWMGNPTLDVMLHIAAALDTNLGDLASGAVWPLRPLTSRDTQAQPALAMEVE
jgi:DNA-binding Xre family transcriptional regulator